MKQVASWVADGVVRLCTGVSRCAAFQPGRSLIQPTGFNVYFTFMAASAMLGISIGFNSLSTHGACTAIFVAVAAVVGFSCGSIQTLGKVSWIAWVGVFGILTAGKHTQALTQA